MQGIMGMWRCPSITSQLGTNEAVPCRKVWISLDNEGTSSPQFRCDAVGERRSSFLGKQQEVQHILTVLGILGLSIISSSSSAGICVSSQESPGI